MTGFLYTSGNVSVVPIPMANWYHN